MRNYILTLRDREAIKNYMRDGSDRNLVKQIRHKAKKALPVIREDLKMVEKII